MGLTILHHRVKEGLCAIKTPYVFYGQIIIPFEAFHLKTFLTDLEPIISQHS